MRAALLKSAAIPVGKNNNVKNAGGELDTFENHISSDASLGNPGLGSFSGEFPRSYTEPSLSEFPRMQPAKAFSLFALVEANTSFRHVISTTQNSQVVIMSLDALGIEGETNAMADQILVVVQGSVQVLLNNVEVHTLCSGSMLTIEAGTYHEVRALPSDNPSSFDNWSSLAKVCITCSPPCFPEDMVQRENPAFGKRAVLAKSKLKDAKSATTNDEPHNPLRSSTNTQRRPRSNTEASTVWGPRLTQDDLNTLSYQTLGSPSVKRSNSVTKRNQEDVSNLRKFEVHGKSSGKSG